MDKKQEITTKIDSPLKEKNASIRNKNRISNKIPLHTCIEVCNYDIV